MAQKPLKVGTAKAPNVTLAKNAPLTVTQANSPKVTSVAQAPTPRITSVGTAQQSAPIPIAKAPTGLNQNTPIMLRDSASIFVDPKTYQVTLTAPQEFLDSPEYKDNYRPIFEQLNNLSIDDPRAKELLSADTIKEINASLGQTLKWVQARKSLKAELSQNIKDIDDKTADYALQNMSAAHRSDNDAQTQLWVGTTDKGELMTKSVKDALGEFDSLDDNGKNRRLKQWEDMYKSDKLSKTDRAIAYSLLNFMAVKGRTTASKATQLNEALLSFQAEAGNNIAGAVWNTLTRPINALTGNGNKTQSELAREALDSRPTMLEGMESARNVGAIGGDIGGLAADLAVTWPFGGAINTAAKSTRIGASMNALLNMDRATKTGRYSQAVARNLIEDAPMSVSFNASRALGSDEDFGTNMLIDAGIMTGLTSAGLLARRALLMAEHAKPGGFMDTANTAVTRTLWNAVDKVQSTPGIGKLLKRGSTNYLDSTAGAARSLRRAVTKGQMTLSEYMQGVNKISAAHRGANMRLQTWVAESPNYKRTVEINTELGEAGKLQNAIDYADARIKIERIESGQLTATDEQLEALQDFVAKNADEDNLRYFEANKIINDEIVEKMQQYGLANPDVIRYMQESDEFADTYMRMQYQVGHHIPGTNRLQAAVNLKNKRAVGRIKGGITEAGAVDPLLAATDYMKHIEEMRLRNEVALFFKEMGLAHVVEDAATRARANSIKVILRANKASVTRAIDSSLDDAEVAITRLIDDLEDPLVAGAPRIDAEIDKLVDDMVDDIVNDKEFRATVLGNLGDDVVDADVALEAVSRERKMIKDEIHKRLIDNDIQKSTADTVLKQIDERINTKLGMYDESVDVGPFKLSTGESQTDRILKNEDTVAGGKSIGDYYREEKGEDWQIVMMTPDAYLKKAARVSGKAKTKTEIDDWISKPMGDVEKYTADMQNGDKFPIPWINERAGSQEGRTRALAAKAAGHKKIPVAYGKKFNPGKTTPQSDEITKKLLGEKPEVKEDVGSLALRDLAEEKKRLNVELRSGQPVPEDTITYFEGGGAGKLEVSDPDLLDYFNSNKSFAETSAAWNLMIAASRAFRAGTTGLNPIHNLVVEPIRNFTRGVIGGGTSVLQPRSAITALMEEAGLSREQAENFYRMAQARRRESGFGSTFWSAPGNDPNRAIRYEELKEMAAQVSDSALGKGKTHVVKLGKHPIRTVENIFNNVDMEVVRRNVFDAVLERSLRNGYSMDEALERAIFYADESSTSFWRTGNKTRNFLRSVPYLSAAINGQASFVRLWTIDPVGVTGRLAGGIVMPVMYLTAQNLLDEDYVNLPDYVKDTNFIIMMPDGSGRIMIPMDYDVARIVNPFREVMEDLYNNDLNLFQTVADALINGTPIDLGGFTERDVEGNIDAGRATVRAISGLLPTAVKGGYEAFTGESLYTGSPVGPSDVDLYNTGQVNAGDDITAGDRTYRVRDSKILRGIADATGIDQSKLQNVMQNFGGQIGQFILNGLDKLAGAPPEQQGGRDFLDTLAGKFVNDGTSGQKSTTDWYRGVDRLEEEKVAVEARIERLSRDAQFADDPAALEERKQEIINEYGQKVANFVNAYGDYYARAGGLRPTQLDSAIRLLIFGPQANTFETGTASWGAQQQAIWDAKNNAEMLAFNLGLPTSTDRDRAGRVMLNADGDPYVDTGSLSTLPGMLQNRYYGAPRQLAYEFEQLVKADSRAGRPSLRDEMSVYYDQLNELYDQAKGLKGKEASAKYKEISNLQEEYMTRVFDARIEPLIKKYGPAVLNNNEVMKELSSYIMVPGDFTPFHSRKKQPYLTADVKNYLQDRYAVGKMSKGNMPTDEEAELMMKAINIDLDEGRHGRASQKLEDLMSDINAGRVAVDTVAMDEIRELIRIANGRK